MLLKDDNMTKRHRMGPRKTAAILFFLICAEWLLMLFAPTIYYKWNNAVAIEATVCEVVEDGEDIVKSHIYVSYQYDGQQYEDVYYLSCKSYSSPPEGFVIPIKISKNDPGRTILPYKEQIPEFENGFVPFLLAIASFILYFLCGRRGFRNAEGEMCVDRECVLQYVRVRELRTMFLVTTAIVPHYFLNTDRLFTLVFTVGAYMLLGSVIRYIRTVVAKHSLPMSTDTVVQTWSETHENGEGLPITRHFVETTLGYVFNAPKSFCEAGDRLVFVDIGWLKNRVMFLRFGKMTPCDITNDEQATPKIRNPMRAFWLAITWMIPVFALVSAIPSCIHTYAPMSEQVPEMIAAGEEKVMCTKCFETKRRDLPELEPRIEGRVTDKQTRTSEYFYIDHEVTITYTLELTNTSEDILRNVMGGIVVYDLNGKKLDVLCFETLPILLPGETQICTATVTYNAFFSYPEELYDRQQTHRYLKLDELQFDFNVHYECDGLPK